MSPSRRPLDLLPLLDVLMVVLFVFATVQEGDLSRAEARAGDAELARSRAEARAAGSERRAEGLQRDADALRAELEALHDDARTGDHERRRELLAKVAEHVRIIEVELTGAPGLDGAISNRCCVRAGPIDGGWRDCGVVPPRSGARASWLVGAGSSLVSTMHADSGSARPAFVVVRQDERATYRIAERLADALALAWPEGTIDTGRVSPSAAHCTARSPDAAGLAGPDGR